MAAPEGNKYALGADSGRPPVFETAQDFANKASEYFTNADETRWTITGLALHLGFCDRQSLYDYQKKDEFSGIVKYCRTMVEMAYEIKLSGANVTGAIFALKNMGWRDKVETGFTDGEGNDVPVTVFQLPDNGRSQTKDNTATGRIPDENAGQSS
jgi:hypothetical protein